jgi:hypothetical protein
MVATSSKILSLASFPGIRQSRLRTLKQIAHLAIAGVQKQRPFDMVDDVPVAPVLEG